MKKEKNEEVNIKVEIKRAIKESGAVLAKDAAKEVVEQLKANRLIKDQVPYAKRIESILYRYSTLKEAVIQKQEDIDYIKENGLPESSKSIVVYSSAGGVSREDRYVELLEKYRVEKIETERELKRIDNALDKIRGDKYYNIIDLKYLYPTATYVSDEMLGETFDVDRRTIIRNRYRLINKLVTILFPESIKELM